MTDLTGSDLSFFGVFVSLFGHMTNFIFTLYTNFENLGPSSYTICGKNSEVMFKPSEKECHVGLGMSAMGAGVENGSTVAA